MSVHEKFRSRHKKSTDRKSQKKVRVINGHGNRGRENERQEGVQSHLSCEAKTTLQKSPLHLKEQITSIYCWINSCITRKTHKESFLNPQIQSLPVTFSQGSNRCMKQLNSVSVSRVTEQDFTVKSWESVCG